MKCPIILLLPLLALIASYPRHATAEDRTHEQQILEKYFEKTKIVRRLTGENDKLIIKLKNGKTHEIPNHDGVCTYSVDDFIPHEIQYNWPDVLVIAASCDSNGSHMSFVNMDNGEMKDFRGATYFSPNKRSMIFIEGDDLYAMQGLTLSLWGGRGLDWSIQFMRNQLDKYTEIQQPNLFKIQSVNWINDKKVEISAEFCSAHLEDDDFNPVICNDKQKLHTFQIVSDPISGVWHIN